MSDWSDVSLSPFHPLSLQLTPTNAPLFVFLRPVSPRDAHQHQRDPEGEDLEAISPQPAVPGPESDPSAAQPQPVHVRASESGAQTGGPGPGPEHQHLLHHPPPTDRSVYLAICQLGCQVDSAHHRHDFSDRLANDKGRVIPKQLHQLFWTTM